MRIKVAITALVLVLPALTGCNSELKSELDYYSPWNENRILAEGWARQGEIRYAPVYCYSTIGWVDCDTRPEPGAANRRVGYPHVGEDAASTMR